MSTLGEEILSETLETLRDLGLIPTITHGKHIKVRWIKDGRRRTLVLSATPSCRRAIYNNRSELRRLLRQPASERAEHHYDKNQRDHQPVDWASDHEKQRRKLRAAHVSRQRLHVLTPRQIALLEEERHRQEAALAAVSADIAARRRLEAEHAAIRQADKEAAAKARREHKRKEEAARLPGQYWIDKQLELYLDDEHRFIAELGAISDDWVHTLESECGKDLCQCWYEPKRKIAAKFPARLPELVRFEKIHHGRLRRLLTKKLKTAVAPEAQFWEKLHACKASGTYGVEALKETIVAFSSADFFEFGAQKIPHAGPALNVVCNGAIISGVPAFGPRHVSVFLDKALRPWRDKNNDAPSAPQTSL